MWRRVLASIVLLAHGGDALAQSCRVLGTYGRAPDNAVVRVTSGGLVSFRANVDVNTDGALQSYKADDLGFFPGGRLNTRTALNTICNGVNRPCWRPGTAPARWALRSSPPLRCW